MTVATATKTTPPKATTRNGNKDDLMLDIQGL